MKEGRRWFLLPVNISSDVLNPYQSLIINMLIIRIVYKKNVTVKHFNEISENRQFVLLC